MAGLGPDQAWPGVGTFDLAKLTAYEGGNLGRLGRYGDAVAVLDTALATLEPTMYRHHCTALIDRAEAHLGGGHVDASCADASAALSIAAHTGHVLSVQRVHRLAQAALRTKAVVARRLWAEVLAVSPNSRHFSRSRLRNCMSSCESTPLVEATPRPNRHYRGLVLDFGGVLTTSFEGALRAYCVRDGLVPDALEKIFNVDEGAQGVLVELERGRISQAEFIAHLAPALGVDPDGLLERMLADLRWEPLVVQAVAELRARGIKVAVLSNSWGSTPFDPYARFHLNEHYDAVVISDQVGMRKPDPEMFALALDRLELPGKQCVFVDDVARYLPPARALGMATIHATDPATTVTELERLFGGPPLHP